MSDVGFNYDFKIFESRILCPGKDVMQDGYGDDADASTLVW